MKGQEGSLNSKASSFNPLNLNRIARRMIRD
jgi:hypothetical protein